MHKKYETVNAEASKTKNQFESFEKKLSDMYNRQINKLDVTFKSITRILD